MIALLEGFNAGLQFVKQLNHRMPGEDLLIQSSVRDIIHRVRTGGRCELLALRKEFEGVDSEQQLSFTLADIKKVLQNSLPQHNNSAVAENDLGITHPTKDLIESLQAAINRVKNYHQIQVEKTATLCEGQSFFASRVQPLDAVALYVPGGKAFYPSSIIMSAIPALLAGVKRVAVFTPARSLQNPVFLKTIEMLEIDEIHAVGGAQAIATAAFGVEGIERFDKIVGPGNIYVSSAKQMLAGRIGIDGFAGPSEILILGDGSSDPKWIAADLLAQAEHDEQASAILVTTSSHEALAVQNELQNILGSLQGNAAIAKASLAKWGAIITVNNREELVTLANAVCSEHLHIHTQCALKKDGQDFWLKALKGVGAIFLGRYSAESFGDYLAGPSHVLPTAGTARFANPLGVYDFVRRSSVLALSAQLATELAQKTKVFAMAEGLHAHALAADLRGSPH